MKTKQCIKCEQIKPLDEFYRNKSRKDGRLERCKECVREYERSPSARARRKRYYYSEKGQAAHKRHKQTPGEACKSTYKYRHSPKGKATQQDYDRKYKEENPGKIRARTAVMHALRKGEMVKPNNCEICEQEHCHLHAHHHSYEYEHWLDVQWTCPPCHKTIHGAT